MIHIIETTKFGRWIVLGMNMQDLLVTILNRRLLRQHTVIIIRK